jgi:alpha-galactosidase
MSTIGFDKQAGKERYAEPNHWNDPDMLEVGNGGMSAHEYRTHMSLWAMLAAPLLAGNDIRGMSDETRDILTNKEVIAVDQDPLGRQGFRVSKAAGGEIWIKPLEKGDLAVALFNRTTSMMSVTAYWAIIGVEGKRKVRDLWLGRDLGSYRESYSAEVPAHGVVLLRILR